MPNLVKSIAAAATLVSATALASTGAAPPVAAHPLNGSCGTFGSVRDDNNETYRVNAGVAAGIRNAIIASATNANNSGTDFHWSSTAGAPDLAWGVYSGGSGTPAHVFTAYSGCELTSNVAEFNTNHSCPSTDSKSCATIHEFGHAEGLRHNSVGLATSIMPSGVHGTRCHGTSPALFFRSHDVNDINAKY